MNVENKALICENENLIIASGICKAACPWKGMQPGQCQGNLPTDLCEYATTVQSLDTAQLPTTLTLTPDQVRNLRKVS